MRKFSVVIADAQFLTRQGLHQILAEHPEYQVVGETCDEQTLLSLLDKHPTDLLVIDYDQGDSLTPLSIKKVTERFPQTRILVISSDNDKQSILRVLETGVNSFLTKTCGAEEIRDA